MLIWCWFAFATLASLSIVSALPANYFNSGDGPTSVIMSSSTVNFFPNPTTTYTSSAISNTDSSAIQSASSEVTALLDSPSGNGTDYRHAYHDVFGWEKSVEIAFFICVGLICTTIPTALYLLLKRRRSRIDSVQHSGTDAPPAENDRDRENSVAETQVSNRPTTALSWLEMLKGTFQVPKPPHDSGNAPTSETQSYGTKAGCGSIGFLNHGRRCRPGNIDAEIIELERQVNLKTQISSTALASNGDDTAHANNQASNVVNRCGTPLPFIGSSALHYPNVNLGGSTGDRIIDVKALDQYVLEGQEGVEQHT